MKSKNCRLTGNLFCIFPMCWTRWVQPFFAIGNVLTFPHKSFWSEWSININISDRSMDPYFLSGPLIPIFWPVDGSRYSDRFIEPYIVTGPLISIFWWVHGCIFSDRSIDHYISDLYFALFPGQRFLFGLIFQKSGPDYDSNIKFGPARIFSKIEISGPYRENSL